MLHMRFYGLHGVVPAVLILSGFVFCVTAFSAKVHASAPIPGHKPEVAQTKVVKYSLRDMAKSLLDFNSAPPPVPKMRPTPKKSGPLSADDVSLYKRIFALQEKGQMDEADDLIARLKTGNLDGHVFYQRYMHPTAYKASFEELRHWLSLYADHPGAHKVYSLAQRRTPDSFDGKLNASRLGSGTAIVNDPMLYPAQKISIEPQAKKAAGLLYGGDIDDAQALAKPAIKELGVDKAPKSAWVLGLASWLDKDYRRSAKYFEAVARSEYASGWLKSAGGYWAARAHMRDGNVAQVSRWLKHSAEYSHSFYGLLATRALGHEFDFNWKEPSLTQAHKATLMSTKPGSRALDLLKVGQRELAEAELAAINTGRDKALRDAVMAYAIHRGMPALAMRLGAYASEVEGRSYDAALYPIGPWQLKGKDVQVPLLHAIIRQESRFNPHAKSGSGAQGLMQIMPRTAAYITHEEKPDLLSPVNSLKIGHKYLKHLLKDGGVDGDLVRLLIAYNAGPGNLSKWQSQWSNIDDPLLFVELIPSGETRIYVERVMANYWIYKLRDHGDVAPASMDAMIGGRAVKYADDFAPSLSAVQLAENG